MFVCHLLALALADFNPYVVEPRTRTAGDAQPGILLQKFLDIAANSGLAVGEKAPPRRLPPSPSPPPRRRAQTAAASSGGSGNTNPTPSPTPASYASQWSYVVMGTIALQA
jgi:hypothetical protein